MLREIEQVRQVPNDYRRRLFSDQEFELYVWYKPDDSFHGFQLCYDPSDKPRALTWREESGFSHQSVDTGEESPLANRTPILKAKSALDVVELKRRFYACDHNLPGEIRHFVREKLEAYEPKS